MAKKHLGTDLENLDVRVTTVERILPTLATKTDLRDTAAPLATKAELATAIAPLATKAELAAAIAPLATKAELAAAIAPLATKVELAAAIAPLATKVELADGLSGLRAEMRTLYESTRSDIQLLADSVLVLHAKVDALAQRSA